MAAGKWIGGFLGFITTGSPLGALAGFALGALFDMGLNSVNATDNTSTFDDGRAHQTISLKSNNTDIINSKYMMDNATRFSSRYSC